MGQVLRPGPSGLVAEPTDEPGVTLIVTAGGPALVWDVCQLVLDPASPLTPRSARTVRAKQGDDRLRLDAGVYWLRVHGVTRELYLQVEAAGAAQVSRAEAYCALGAVETLRAMGLEDAAVSLRAGDFDLASVQVLEELERRRQQG